METSPSGYPVHRVHIPEDEMDRVEDLDKIEMTYSSSATFRSRFPDAFRDVVSAQSSAASSVAPTMITTSTTDDYHSIVTGMKTMHDSGSAWGDVDRAREFGYAHGRGGRGGGNAKTNGFDLDDPSLTADEEARLRLQLLMQTPLFRRTAVSLFIVTLLTLSLRLLLENTIHAKGPTDWIEPAATSALMEDEGFDWSPGEDAPRPVKGARVPPHIEKLLADWMGGTTRVPSVYVKDEFGSITLSDRVVSRDVPLLWDVPFSGGNVVENALGGCLKLVQASNEGAELAGVTNLNVVYKLGKKYVNVDVTTGVGIERAKAMGLASSGIADVVITPLLHDATTLFVKSAKEKNENDQSSSSGRLFLVARHPVERALARFRRLRVLAFAERKYPQMDAFPPEKLMSMTYREYANSELLEDNRVARTLVRKSTTEVLTPTDMATSKEILRTKAVIGLREELTGAVRHFARYFGWDNARNGGKLSSDVLKCVGNVVLRLGKNQDEEGGNDLDTVGEGSEVWNTIMERNAFDHELYLYSLMLYKYQMQLD